MKRLKNILFNRKSVKRVLKPHVKFHSSIYGRVVFFIFISVVFLFVSFWVIFRSLNEQYFESVLHDKGMNIGSLVEGALYRSMLENDRQSLQNTLDIIDTMSGIDDVNMYDTNNNLVYTSISRDSLHHSDPDCKSCHIDFASMFEEKEKSYRVIDVETECSMNQNPFNSRHLLIKSPILNSPSCSTTDCHAHSQEEEVLGSLLIKLPMKDLDDALSASTKDYIILAAIMSSLLFIFLILFTYKQIENPLNAIIRASQAVTKGDKSTRLEIKTRQLSDIRTVSLAFNNMLDNLQAANKELQNWSKQLEYKVQKKSEELGQVQNELINIERIASLGKLSLSVAHEINNPLSGILVYAKLIQKQLQKVLADEDKKEPLLKNLKLIESETKRCGDIVKGLLDFSRKDQNDFEAKHIHDVLHETYELMAHSMKVAGIDFVVDFGARNDLIHCSPNQIKQICIAILVNASEAVSENGEIIFRTSNPNDESIRIEVIDNGVGIPEANIQRVFEPFFSTKEKTSGIGLGLAIVHGIVQNHNGKTDIVSDKGKGTSIIITLPLANT
ncbi:MULTISPECIES: ATP-binding protein [unclassified Carboxylicivirga]|uniref:sensor histidine kinase n=1 Tax=Carboxylicivirga TaxID=1628153 RepID=UPI003D351D15